MYKFTLLFLVAIILTACGGSATQEANNETADSEVAAPAITLSPMPAATAFPDAAITGMEHKDGKFQFSASNYEFGVQTPDADQLMCANSGQGQHLHVIINNEPYLAKYSPEFELELPDGDHHFLAFLSRSYHLSIKEPQAARALNVRVKDNAFAETSPIEAPMLFYSRPKGVYRGSKETENIILDFYPVNAPEGAYKVKAQINDQEFILDSFEPSYIKGLPMGEHTVTLTLLNAAGEVVDTPLNPVSRKITLEELPTGE